MKKGLILFICAVMLFCFLSVPAVAAETSFHYNDVIITRSTFSIVNNKAFITMKYESNNDVDSVTVTATLQKRYLLVFWDNVFEVTHYNLMPGVPDAYSPSVTSGHYRVKFRYEVNCNGQTDVIEEVIEATN